MNTYNIEDIAHAIKYSVVCPFDYKRDCAGSSKKTEYCERCTLNYFKERDKRIIEDTIDEMADKLATTLIDIDKIDADSMISVIYDLRDKLKEKKE